MISFKILFQSKEKIKACDLRRYFKGIHKWGFNPFFDHHFCQACGICECGYEDILAG